MNIFITGGTGFFGKALLRHWKRVGSPFDKIFILSRNPKSFIKDCYGLIAELNVEFIQGDILEASKIALNENIDYVLHAAADSTIGPSLGRVEVFNQIVKGTEEVLKFASNHNVKKFLLTSSGAVYGSQPSQLEKIPEDYLGIPDPLDPKSAYGIGKRTAEHISALYADKEGFDYVIARCFAFVGEDLPLNAQYAIGNFIKDAISGRDIVINGDGSPLRSYLYQYDLASCITSMLLNETIYNVYNVGSDIEISIEELAIKIRDKFSSDSKIIIKRKSDSNIKNRYVPNIDRLKAEFSHNDFMNLDASLDETLKNLKI